MKKLVSFALLIVCLVPASTKATCQDPVAALLNTQYASNIPGILQGQVAAGALIIVQEKDHAVGFADASDKAIALPHRPASLTLGNMQLAGVAKGALNVSLLGYDPGASFGSGTQLSYDGAVLTGDRLTGYQLTDLITNDQETKTNIKGWLYKGYHVYIVESVLATPTLYVTATNTLGGEVHLNKQAEGCTASVPSLPALPNQPGNSPPPPNPQTPAGASVSPPDGQAGQPAAAGSPATKNQSGSDKPVDNKATALQSVKAALPITVEASLCKAGAGKYSLSSPTPVNIAVKLNEITYSVDKKTGAVIYDYKPSRVQF